MEQETTTDTGAQSSAGESAAAPESFGNVADTFSEIFAQPAAAEPAQQGEGEPPATMTDIAEQQEGEPQQAAADDALPEFSLEDAPASIERLYSAEELAQLAQTDPNAAWAYAEQANSYLLQNLQTIQDLTGAAEKVGSMEALTTLGDLGAALFSPTEDTPATVYQTLMKLQESYPDSENGPMNQVARALANYRAPEMLAEMGDQLATLLDGTHPYLALETYQPQSDTVRYQVEKYIGHLNQQRTDLIEMLAPIIYKHFGNDFGLREQYRMVGPEGEFYGLADNTIDKAIRKDLPQELQPIYDQMPPGIRGRLNLASREEILDNLTQRKAAADAQVKLDSITKENAENLNKVNERIENQIKEQADARAKNWEDGVTGYINDRLTNTYKLGAYPVKIIQRELKDFMQTDPQASQIYNKALEAAKAGNLPLLKRLEGDLSRKAETAIRNSLDAWQKATGQRVTRSAPPAPQSKQKVAPLYNGPRSVTGNGHDSEYGSVADEFGNALKNFAPYVNQ